MIFLFYNFETILAVEVVLLWVLFFYLKCKHLYYLHDTERLSSKANWRQIEMHRLESIEDIMKKIKISILRASQVAQ